MKNLRKTTAALLTTAVVAGGGPASAAEIVQWQFETKKHSETSNIPANLLQETQAIAKARDMFDILSDFPSTHSYFRENHPYSRNPVWLIDFTRQNPNPRINNPDGPPPELFHVELDAKTGELLSFRHQNPDWTGSKIPPAETAKQTASAFLKKFDPNLYSRVWLNANVGGSGGTTSGDSNGKRYTWTHASVNFYELVNGIPFKSNRVQIDVDEYGHVVGMQRMFRFDSGKLPDPARAVPIEEIRNELAKQLKMEKRYVTRLPKKGEDGQMQWVDSPVLAYFPVHVPAFDALTGQISDPWIRPFFEQERKSYKVIGGEQPGVAKDKEDAERLVSDLLKLDLSQLQFTERNGENYGLERGIRTFIWSEKPARDNPQPLFINAMFDAETGRLLHVHVNGKKHTGNQPAFSLEEGEAKALEILKKQLPAGEWNLILLSAVDRSKPFPSPKWFDPEKENGKIINPEAVYSYSFVLGHQGVPVMDQYYSVELDTATGELTSLFLPFGTVGNLPDNRNTVSAEEAKTEFLRSHPLQLVYVWPEFFSQAAPEGQLRYEIDPLYQTFQYIDAFTGKTVTIDDK